MVPLDERLSIFQRVGFDVTPDIEIFGQFSYNRSVSASSYQQTPSTGVVIQADNAYLHSQYPALAAQIAARGLGSITIGTSNAGFPIPGSDIKREVYRFVGGAKRNLDLFQRSLAWDVYYQKGVTKAREELTNTWKNARMALAQEAVAGPGGSVVCRSTLTSPANGCVPIDRLGLEGPSQEAAALVEAQRKQIQVMIDQIFSYAEPGFQEQKTSEYLIGILEKNGFTVQRGVAGVPTAFAST